jgi:hypothetical protein
VTPLHRELSKAPLIEDAPKDGTFVEIGLYARLTGTWLGWTRARWGKVYGEECWVNEAGQRLVGMMMGATRYRPLDEDKP